MKKGLLLKILLSVIPVVAIAAVVITLVVVKPWKAKSAGTCTIIVELKDKKLEEKVSYEKNETLSNIVINKFDAKFSGTFMTEIGGYTPDTTTDPSKSEYWAFYYNDELVTKLKDADDSLNDDEKAILTYITEQNANWINVVKDDLYKEENNFKKSAVDSLVKKGFIKIEEQFIYSSVGVMEAPLVNKRVYKFVIETYDATLYA